MNLPEQGISGPFRISSIKHIVPQKEPVDEEPDDEWGYRPVTGLFTHISNQVYNITFDNTEVLGVTSSHPIYSETYKEWRQAGDLEIGEKVLTLKGTTKVVSLKPDPTPQMVYNLEVKDLHNFLVGDEGLVVHNSSWHYFTDELDKIKKYINDFIGPQGWKDNLLDEVEEFAGDVFIETGEKLKGEAVQKIAKRAKDF